jgi:hypothetical protein
MPWALSWLPDSLGLPYTYLSQQRGHFAIINDRKKDISMKKEVKIRDL